MYGTNALSRGKPHRQSDYLWPHYRVVNLAGTLQSRLFDHIDLRVRNRTRAQEFFAKILPAIGFTLDKSAEKWGAFEKDGGGKPSEFFGFTEDANHRPNETRIAFWAETREQVDRVAKIVREAGGQTWKGHKSGLSTVLVITRYFLKIPMETNWRFAVAGAQSLRIEADQGKIRCVSVQG